MQKTIRSVVLLSLTAVTAVAAQGPGPGGPGASRRMGPGGPPAAQMLLAQTGELELTDAQVVRLAAIARRSESRRRALRAAMDSAETRFRGQPGDTTARRQFAQRMQADMQRAQDQMQADQRDAIAVLTPDQQAKAWNLVANRRPGMGEGRGMRGPGRERGMRRMPGTRGERQNGMRPKRPMGEPGFRGDERGPRPERRIVRPPRPIDG
jgi:Spy/CpxP family protein refolding chaperone